RYPGVEALKSLSITLEQGRILGLLGPNGSGKTTFMKLVLGFLRPQRGKVTVFGMKPYWAIRERIAYVSELDMLYSWMTVDEIMQFTSKFYRDWDKSKQGELIELMDLDPHKKISTLSKGMRARLRIALALSRKADLVLFDDPFSGIDLLSREKIQDALIRTYRYKEQSVIISTHIVKEAEPLFDEVAFLDEGKLVLQGNADDLRSKHKKTITDLYKEVFR
ncbi:MAG TPA: ABC transporter ATP-binding protein, partial [bacterium (Candidatus Stahlbacteria)]|nr:ABC transporter ATP-binding protein [Candidatus Stahlbacteria bacterium]